MKMYEVSPQDTASHFIGSGALDYSWWGIMSAYGIAQLDVPDDWYVVLVDEDEPGEAVRVDHTVILKAVNTLARTAKGNCPEYMRQSVLRECGVFIKDPEGADFDADMADQVLQYIVFGKVIYA
ncbi:hypothetical protein MOQ72_37120 [Saccharopolyspora sp. K220]|uniref:hypothetical protein n=1 Tax=Saccharopolyspora soli TaxID=2926618 RepID=UPI001F588083|nr:hypothetical protein [Saccharopolyspora soli]MCI2423054.1 hypothetical protein [Saccharopolyspora soli]